MNKLLEYRILDFDANERGSTVYFELFWNGERLTVDGDDCLMLSADEFECFVAKVKPGRREPVKFKSIIPPTSKAGRMVQPELKAANIVVKNKRMLHDALKHTKALGKQVRHGRR